MSKNGHSWHGSENPEELDGRATFVVGKIKAEMELQSFTDFYTICRLLEVSSRLSAVQTLANVSKAVNHALEAV